MNDFIATHELSTTASSPAPSQRIGLWRAISAIVVVAALLITAFSVLQSRNSSNVAIANRTTVALEQILVTVTDIDVPADAEVGVLGLASNESRQPFSVDGGSIDVPSSAPALVALFDANDSIVGLAVSPLSETGRDVTISAQSTAQALLFMSPGILRPDYDAVQATVIVIETDPAFVNLRDAIAANSNLSISNPQLEQAFAAIADRTPVQRPEPDQGCDSVFASDAYPSAGTCVQPKDTGLVLTNEQDRWALIYSGPPGFSELCAVIAPVDTDDSEVLVQSEQCAGDALVVAPGPVVNQGADQATIDDRVRAAVAVTQLHNYAGPFAELAGASAGFSSGSVQHIRTNTSDVVEPITRLIDTDPDFAEALDISTMTSTARERFEAAITTTRLIIDTADTTALIPQRVPRDRSHVDLLNFYERAGELMTSERTDWRWEADAVGMANFEVGP